MRLILITAFFCNVWSIGILPRANTPSSAESAESDATLNPIVPVGNPPQFQQNQIQFIDPIIPPNLVIPHLENAAQNPPGNFWPNRRRQRPQPVRVVQEENNNHHDTLSRIVPASPLLYYTPPILRTNVAPPESRGDDSHDSVSRILEAAYEQAMQPDSNPPSSPGSFGFNPVQSPRGSIARSSPSSIGFSPGSLRSIHNSRGSSPNSHGSPPDLGPPH